LSTGSFVRTCSGQAEQKAGNREQSPHVKPLQIFDRLAIIEELCLPPRSTSKLLFGSDGDHIYMVAPVG
jgi:hypothetical protein